MSENRNEFTERVRRAIRDMRRYKRVNRLPGGVRLFVGEDMLPDLMAGGALVRDLRGKRSLDGVRVLVVKGYPKGYFAVE